VEKPALDWPTRLNIVKGVAKGLAYLHSELPASLSIPHGHLKSSNVVLDKSFQPLLMDYGLVPVVNQEHVQQLLVAYKSPEYSQHGSTTRKSDVWNLGILIIEILTSKFPTSYLTQDGAGYHGTHRGPWANFVAGENQISSSPTMSIFDAEMGSTENSEEEMQKLLTIGMACCEEDVDKRWDLKEAVDRIEAIKERDVKGGGDL
jgi:serine/threonine protein kinase